MNPFELTQEQREILMLHKPRLHAERLLEKARSGEIKLTKDGWYDLTLAATGSKEKAQDVYEAFLRAHVRKGIPVE